MRRVRPMETGEMSLRWRRKCHQPTHQVSRRQGEGDSPLGRVLVKLVAQLAQEHPWRGRAERRRVAQRRRAETSQRGSQRWPFGLSCLTGLPAAVEAVFPRAIFHLPGPEDHLQGGQRRRGDGGARVGRGEVGTEVRPRLQAVANEDDGVAALPAIPAGAAARLLHHLKPRPS